MESFVPSCFLSSDRPHCPLRSWNSSYVQANLSEKNRRNPAQAVLPFVGQSLNLFLPFRQDFPETFTPHEHQKVNQIRKAQKLQTCLNFYCGHEFMRVSSCTFGAFRAKGIAHKTHDNPCAPLSCASLSCPKTKLFQNWRCVPLVFNKTSTLCRSTNARIILCVCISNGISFVCHPDQKHKRHRTKWRPMKCEKFCICVIRGEITSLVTCRSTVVQRLGFFFFALIDIFPSAICSNTHWKPHWMKASVKVGSSWFERWNVGQDPEDRTKTTRGQISSRIRKSFDFHNIVTFNSEKRLTKSKSAVSPALWGHHGQIPGWITWELCVCKQQCSFWLPRSCRRILLTTAITSHPSYPPVCSIPNLHKQSSYSYCTRFADFSCVPWQRREIQKEADRKCDHQQGAGKQVTLDAVSPPNGWQVLTIGVVDVML